LKIQNPKSKIGLEKRKEKIYFQKNFRKIKKEMFYQQYYVNALASKLINRKLKFKISVK